MVQVGDAWMPIFSSTPMQRTALREPSSSRNFGTMNMRDALRARRRAFDAREHEVDDVGGEIVLAPGDENLLAGDGVGAIGLRHGLGRERAEIRAGLRLGQIHRAGPFAGDQLFQIERF